MNKVRVLRSFNCSVPDRWTQSLIFRSFRTGEIVSDEYTAQVLLDYRCPVVPLDDTLSTTCPMCHVTAHREHQQRTLTVAEANCGVPYNGQFYSFRPGDVVQPHLCPVIAEAGVPLTTVTGIECPNCHYLFY